MIVVDLIDDPVSLIKEDIPLGNPWRLRHATKMTGWPDQSANFLAVWASVSLETPKLEAKAFCAGTGVSVKNDVI